MPVELIRALPVFNDRTNRLVRFPYRVRLPIFLNDFEGIVLGWAPIRLRIEARMLFVRAGGENEAQKEE
jgi:hypothetical protein